MQRTNSTDWSIADPITSARLNDFNEDLDILFESISNEDLDLTYNIQGRLTQVIDNENSITIDISWLDFEAEVPKLYIQKDGDAKRYTITYNAEGYIASILYATAP